MKKTTHYKGLILETVNIGTINERCIASDKEGNPVYGTQSDYNKFNAVEKMKAKINSKKEVKKLIHEFNEIRASQRQSFNSIQDWLQHGKEIAEKKAAILKKIESLTK